MGKKKFLASPSDNVILEIADDHLSATLTIRSRSSLIIEEEITKLIEMAEIKCGFEEAKLYNKEHHINKDFDEPFMIVYCPLPKNPKVYYLFNHDKCINPDNIKSVFQLCKSKAVSIGDPVAEVVLTEAEQVDKILNIFGEEVDVEELNETILNDHVGDNVYYCDIEKKIVAERSGYVYLDKDEKISILSDFEFMENISDTKLDLKGNIIINGNIDSTNFSVDGNLVVNGQILNCIDEWCFINGKLTVESIENSHIACNGDLNLAKSVRFSILAVDGNIIGGEGSTIVGGLTQASGDITIESLGSPFSIVTEVDITTSPYSKSKILSLNTEEEQVKSKDIEDSEETGLSLLKSYNRVIKDELEEVLTNEINNRKISVNKTIYSDTNLRIFKNSQQIIGEQQCVEFIQNN